MTQISSYFAGDTLDVTRTVNSVPTTDALVKAWFTAKATLFDADPGIVQKVITTVNVAGVGQITQDGSPASGNGTGTLVFNLLAADTALLTPGHAYAFDVKVKLASGKLYTVDVGSVIMLAKVTTATT
jgi:hypothetical protein